MKHRLRLSLLAIWVLFLAACGSKTETTTTETKPLPASIGLFSPIQLGIDSTEIFMEDYFPNGEWPDSIHMDSHVKWTADKATKRIVTHGKDDALPWLSTLDLWFGKQQYNILVRRAREVDVAVTFDPKGKTFSQVQVAGEINGWNPANSPMQLLDGKWQAHFLLNPGRYQYQIVVDGAWMLDPGNPVKVENGIGGWNSELLVGEGLGRSVDAVRLRCGSTASEELHILPMRTDSGLVPFKSEDVFVFWENERMAPSEAHLDPKTQALSFKIPQCTRALKQSHIRIFAQTDRFWTNDLLIPLREGKVVHDVRGLTEPDPQSNTIYFMMVDRFLNGDKANDAPLNDPRVDPKANFHGGDLAGIRQKIKDGYFDSLGINMLWISPIVQNPEGAYQEYPEPRRWFSGYHGYWPVSSRHVDHRFGTDQELKDLVKEAHEHGIKVILDYVANHLHEEHPMIKAHPDWKTELYLKDSVLNVRLWDTHRIGTWFDTFMPSLDYSKPEVVEFQSDSALYWVEQFGLDGFRQDATKHIPTHFWRRLTQKIKAKYMIPHDRQLYQIGETFGSRELIGSYVGSGLLDAQFDFNYYWTLKGVFGGTEKMLQRLPESLQASETAYGSHSLMGNITGNHDMPRFISYAGEAISGSEDPKEAGWNRDVQIKNLDGFKRLQLLQAWLLMGPGVPVIYYGDEIGMVGAGDPDNRRDMKFSGLTPEEASTKAIVSKLAQIRKSSMATLYGSTEVFVQGNVVAMKRQYLSSPLWLVANLGPKEASFQFPSSEDVETILKMSQMHFSTGKIEADPLRITLPSLGFEVLEGA
ncbi:MAG: alpha-amylase family glycosyl hydrolase [Bacteroidia bacterium]